MLNKIILLLFNLFYSSVYLQQLRNCFLPPILTTKCNASERYRNLDGMCNNLKNPLWGIAGSPLVRLMKANYSDFTNEPRGFSGNTNLPNPRWISQKNHPDNDNPDARFTHMVMQFGQFLDHDITVTPHDERIDCCIEEKTDARCFVIPIPPRDRFYSWVNYTASCINFVRSTPVCQQKIREQYNGITSFVDASNVYGSSVGQLSFIRRYENGELIFNRNTQQLPTREQINLRPDTRPIRPQKQMDFVAGDNRVNEHPFLSAMHVIFLREHNRIAAQFKKYLRNELKNDEVIFQETKRLVNAEMQNIVYGEFLPTILGAKMMKKYKLLANEDSLYDPDVNPNVINSFTTAAFRFGHSMINSMFMLISGKNQNSASFWRLREIFDGNNVDGQRLPLEEMIEGLVSQMPQTTDAYFSTEITNHLFQKNDRQENFGLDLLAINIQRGRDHGVPAYNAFRKLCGLTPLTSWKLKPSEFTEEFWNNLKDVYLSVDDIDLMIGGIAEKNVKGGAVGSTFACIIGEQFKRLKYGDRFFYTHISNNDFNSKGLGYVSKSYILNRTLGDILCENTELDIIQKWVTLQPDIKYNPQEPCESRPVMNFQAIAEEIESELLLKPKKRNFDTRNGREVTKSGLLNVICQKLGVC